MRGEGGRVIVCRGASISRLLFPTDGIRYRRAGGREHIAIQHHLSCHARHAELNRVPESVIAPKLDGSGIECTPSARSMWIRISPDSASRLPGSGPCV